MKIYYINIEGLKDKKKFNEYYNLMQKDRKQKIDRISVTNAKRQSLGAGILIEHIKKTENINGGIIVNKNNKPAFENGEIEFNISHSKNYVVAAVSKYPIGIDTEDIKRKTEFSMAERRIVNTQFAPKEQEYILNSSSEKRMLWKFFRVWTIKEAYLKMEGTGIVRPLYTFEVDFDEECPKILSDEECKITEFKIGTGNIVSVCHNKKDNEYTMEEIYTI